MKHFERNAVLFAMLIHLVFADSFNTLQSSVQTVSIPGESVFVSQTHVYFLTINGTRAAVSNVSFRFDVPPINPVILTKILKFQLPRLQEVVDQCAKLECNLQDSAGKSLHKIRGTCDDNAQEETMKTNVVYVPGARNVTCEVIWEHRHRPEAVDGTLEIYFISAGDGQCEAEEREKGFQTGIFSSLRDHDYNKVERTLCLPRDAIGLGLKDFTVLERPSPCSLNCILMALVCSLLIAIFGIMCVILVIWRRHRNASQPYMSVVTQTSADVCENRQDNKDGDGASYCPH